MSVRLDATSHVLDRLFEVIERRRDERPSGSYVVSLLDGGLPTISEKVREEADEVVRAAGGESDEALAHEVADLVFHVFVLLAARRVEPSAIYRELAPSLELYRVRVGDSLTIKAFTKSGYVQSANLKVYGTFAFKGLEK